MSRSHGSRLPNRARSGSGGRAPPGLSGRSRRPWLLRWPIQTRKACPSISTAHPLPTIGRRSPRHVGDGLESMLDLQPLPEFSGAHVEHLIWTDHSGGATHLGAVVVLRALKWLRLQSIGKAGRARAATLGGPYLPGHDSVEILHHCYDLRSNFVDRGARHGQWRCIPAGERQWSEHLVNCRLSAWATA
jgi:hypothetical protein